MLMKRYGSRSRAPGTWRSLITHLRSRRYCACLDDWPEAFILWYSSVGRLGASRAGLLAMTLGEVPASGALDRLRQRRAELGLPAGPGAPLLIDPATGERIREEAAPLHLRRARSTRISIEANSSICRGMLRHRYDSGGLGQAPEEERKAQ